MLALSQKTALVGAAAIIAIILGAALLLQPAPAPPAPPAPADNSTSVTSAQFLNIFGNARTLGVFMDARGTANSTLRQNVYQCGADLAGSIAGSPVLAERDRIVAACDESSCLLSKSADNSTVNATEAEVMSALRSTVYFHIRGGEAKAPAFYSNRVEMVASSLTNSSCKLSLTTETIAPAAPSPQGASTIPAGTFENRPWEKITTDNSTGNQTNES